MRGGEAVHREGQIGARAIVDEAHWEAVHGQVGRVRRRRYGVWSFSFLAELAKHLGTFPQVSTTEFLEVGCAPGRFLVYFHQVYGWRVAGIELSEAGLAKTRAVLDANGVEARLYAGDVLTMEPEREYDVVGAFGLVEHFDDPVPCYRAMARWVRRGGALIVTVPNLLGPLGRAMRYRNPEDYAGHRRFGPRDLARDCAAAGLEVRFRGIVGDVYVPPVFDALKATAVQRLVNLPGEAANRVVSRVAEVMQRPIKLGSLTNYVGCVAWKRGCGGGSVAG